MHLLYRIKDDGLLQKTELRVWIYAVLDKPQN